jgi:hypothetical protein
VFHWIVYYRYTNNYSYSILDHNKSAFELALKDEKGNDLNSVLVTAVDRYGNESVAKEIMPKMSGIR